MKKQTAFINKESALVGRKNGHVCRVKIKQTSIVPPHSPVIEVPDKDVLNRTAIIVVNSNSPQSMEIANYYIDKRGQLAERDNKFESIDVISIPFAPPAYREDGSLRVVSSANDVTPSVLDELLVDPVIEYIHEILPKNPGYIIFSKDCPLYFGKDVLDRWKNTNTTLESYLYFGLVNSVDLDIKTVSITRLEGRTVQDVKDIIDRSVESDTCDMSNMTCCINNEGSHEGAGRLDWAVISARSIPAIADRAIVHSHLDYPDIEHINPQLLSDVPITQNTGFYLDLSGIYLTKTRSVLYEPIDFITGLVPELRDGKLIDIIPAPYNVYVGWGWDRIYIRYHDEKFLEDKVTIDSIPQHEGSSFSVSNVPKLDYRVDDCVWLLVSPNPSPKPYISDYQVSGRITAYNSELDTITMECVWRHDPDGEWVADVDPGTQAQMMFGKNLYFENDIEVSEDYSSPQEITWLTDRPDDRPFWFPLSKAISAALYRYEQIQYLPGAFTYHMNSACGSAGGLVNKTKYERDSVYTFYPQMNRPNGATLAIGSPVEPNGDGLGNVNYIMLMMLAGYNFGFSTIYGVLKAKNEWVIRDSHTNIVGDPLCSPYTRDPLITFEDIGRVYWSNRWVTGRNFEEVGLNNSCFT